MRLEDFSRGSAWAIDPEAYESMARRVREKVYKSGAEELAMAELPAGKREGSGYSINGRAAVIELAGPITRKATSWSRFFGGSDLESFQAALAAAGDDPGVDSVFLAIDSPGGTVAGVSGAAQALFDFRGKKPVTAYSSGMMASAAYWIASAADRVVVDETAAVGSIGILMVHTDFSGMDARLGIKTTYLTAGKYKAMGNSDEPLSNEARAYFQERLDQTYAIFVSAVARNRGVSAEVVEKDMADGRIFIGRAAVAAGLADEVAYEADALGALSGGRQTMRAGVSGMEVDMTIKTVKDLREAHGDLVQLIEAEARESAGKDFETRLAAETTKRDAHLLALVDAHFGPEAGAGFRKIAVSGIDAATYAAVREAVLPAREENANAQNGAAMQAAMATIAAAGAPAVGANTPSAAEKPFDVLVTEHMAATGVKKSVAIQAVMKANRAAYDAWLARKQK